MPIPLAPLPSVTDRTLAWSSVLSPASWRRRQRFANRCPRGDVLLVDNGPVNRCPQESHRVSSGWACETLPLRVRHAAGSLATRAARSTRRPRDAGMNSSRRQPGGASRPNMARNSAVVLVTGKGSSGTGTPSARHSGSQPSAGRHSTRRSRGTAFRTAALWRS